MVYQGKARQLNYGEAIGILLIENYAPFIPGDVANATTYPYPVRYRPVMGTTPQRLFSHDNSLIDSLREAVEELQAAGVRAITGDCGFLAQFQQDLSEEFSLPLFLSSLMQIPFIAQLIGRTRKIGIVTANSKALDTKTLRATGVGEELEHQLVMKGLEDNRPFVESVFEESGELDSDEFEKAVVERAVLMKEEHPDLGAILLECSLLPPYGKAVYDAVGLPVFDYITMIDFVHSAVVKKNYTGIM